MLVIIIYVQIRGVATGGPKSVYLKKILCGCFVSLTQHKFIYTHPDQIPGYALGSD